MTDIAPREDEQGRPWCSGWRHGQHGGCVNAHLGGPDECQHACYADDMAAPVGCPPAFARMTQELEECRQLIAKLSCPSELADFDQVIVATDEGRALLKKGAQ